MIVVLKIEFLLSTKYYLQITDVSYVESKSDDEILLNYIRHFLIDEIKENIPISNKPKNLKEFIE